MTRVSGTNIIKAPCCGALMSTPCYSSINFSAWEYWTDGCSDGNLAPAGEGLRRCVCGQFFLISAAEYVRTIRSPKPPAPAGWESRKDNWWTRLLGRKTREQVLARCDTRPDAEIHFEQSSIPPSPGYFKEADLLSLINGGLPDLEVEKVVRRLYWRYLNAPSREIYRKFREAHKDVDAAGDSSTFPDFQPSPEQTENMLRLIELLNVSEKPDWLEVAELYRELGDMAAARNALSQMTGEPQRWHFVIRKLTSLGVRCPVRFNY